MEVHKHPHHVTHKKKWTEYLLEFFMLFLAVFLGFIAENVRENISIKDREKEYIRSYVEDLENDLATVDRVKPLMMALARNYDTLLDLIKTPTANVNHMYLLAAKSPTSWQFVTNDRTILQIKNQGGYSLLKNKQFVNLTIIYDKIIETLKTFGDAEDLKYRDEIIDATDKIFDANVFRDIKERKPITGLENLSLLSTDKILLNQYNYLIQQRLVMLQYKTQQLDHIHLLADSTIRFLVSTYSFVKETEMKNINYLQRTLEQTLLQQGKAAFINQYKLFKSESKTDDWKDANSDGILNQMGYDLLAKKQNAKAIIVFQLQAQEYPNDWNSFDSMGDGYAAIKDTANAIASYKKAIEISAADTASKAKLKALGKK